MKREVADRKVRFFRGECPIHETGRQVTLKQKIASFGFLWGVYALKKAIAVCFCSEFDYPEMRIALSGFYLRMGGNTRRCGYTSELSCRKHNGKGAGRIASFRKTTPEKIYRRDKYGSKSKNQNQVEGL